MNSRLACPSRMQISTFALVLALMGPLTIAPAGAADGAPTCSLEGLNLNADRDFIAGLHPSDRANGIRKISCRVAQHTEHVAGDTKLRVSRAELFNGAVGDPGINPSLVTIEKIESAGARSLGRIVFNPDPLDGEMRFEPQVVQSGGDILIRLAPRHHSIYRLTGEKLGLFPAFGWRDAPDVLPGGVKGGQALSIDLEKMEARLSLAPDASSENTALPSAFMSPRIALVRLTYASGTFAAAGTSVVERKAGEETFIDEINEMEANLRAEIKNLPAGTEACAVSGWSNDPDRNGLNVRAEPSGNARILGIVPPPRKMPKEQDAFGSEPVKAEFSIIGFRNGWFLIEKIQAPGVPYDVAYPRNLPQPFKGRGWVAANKIGAAPAHTGLPAGRLYEAPFVEARYQEVIVGGESLFGPDTPLAKVQACSGRWGLVETKEGKRGWTRSLCSNQVTNCS